MLERIEAWLEHRAARRQRELEDDMSFEYNPRHDFSHQQDELLVDQLVAWIGPRLLWLLPLTICVATAIGYGLGLVSNG